MGGKDGKLCYWIAECRPWECQKSEAEPKQLHGELWNLQIAKFQMINSAFSM